MKAKIVLGILLTVLLVNLVSAASFSVSPASLTFSQSVSSENFTAANLNLSVPLNILFSSLSIAGESSSSAVFNVVGDPNNITASRQFTVQPSPSIDYSNFKVGKTYSGTLLISNALIPSDTQSLAVTIAKSYCSNGELGTNLSISSVDITNNGEGDDTTWKPLDEIKIEVTVDNNNDDESDKIDTIVKIGLYNPDGKEKLSLDKLKFGKISGGNDKTMSVTFTVPSDLGIDESDYQLDVKAYQNSKEEEICTSDTTDISVDREDNEDRYVILNDIIVDPTSASCGNDITLTANAVNIGSDDQDKVKVTLMFRGREITHPELGRKLLQRMAMILREERGFRQG
jgi:hypothetical protein